MNYEDVRKGKDMKDIGFRKEISTAGFLSPLEGFKKREVAIEERYDETTGVASRVLPFRARPGQKADLNFYLQKSPESLCPFCPELFDTSTPRFTPDIAPEGRFRRGGACLFPNAFPYDKSSTVAIFSSRHFVPMDGLTPEFMRDGFAVCRDYFSRLAQVRPEYRYCSINWNYMPQSGGGLIHPHLQTIAGPGPTRFMQKLITSTQSYARATGGNVWRDLLDGEREAGERFIADTGTVCWLAAFSPRGMAGEIDFIVKEKTSFFELSAADVEELLGGLSRIFSYLSANNFISFNLAIYAMSGGDDVWIQGKIVPRLELNALGTSDLNYFEKLHDEIICLAVPEQQCRELQPYFNK
jgi:UDPglucose--hexose-1-phosphate uridylyltransferase